jgi:hypothetical protein
MNYKYDFVCFSGAMQAGGSLIGLRSTSFALR